MWDEDEARANVASCAHELLRLVNHLQTHGCGTRWQGLGRVACEAQLRSIEEDLAYVAFSLQGLLGMRSQW